MLEHAGTRVDEADAGTDVGRTPERGLLRPVGVGDQGPADDDPVAIAAAQRRLGDRRPLDTADREHRDRERAPEERCRLDMRRFDVVEHRYRVRHRPVDPAGHHDGVCARPHEHACGVDRSGRPDAPRDVVVAVQPDDEREARRRAAHLPEHVRPESGALRRRGPAVLVVSLVARRREELVHEVAMTGVQLDGVEACLCRPFGGLRERLDDRLDLGAGEPERSLLHVDGRGDRRRRDGLEARDTGRHLPAAVPELQAGSAPGVVQRGDEWCEVGGDVASPHPRQALLDAPLRCDGAERHHRHPHRSAARLEVPAERLVGDALVESEPGRHG